MPALAQGAPSLTARLDREVVPLGESVTLTLVFDGVNPGTTPNLPALPNVNVAGVSHASEITVDQGQTTARLSFNYTLVPTQVGEITIPALQVPAGGRVFTSQPLKLRVVAANPANAATNLAFLRLVVPKSEVYLGETFPVEIHLYFQNIDPRSVQMPQLKAEGFSVGRPAEPTQTSTRVGNVPYNLAIFKTSATPAKTGSLALGAAECQLTILVPVNDGRRRDVFDPFGILGPRVQARPTLLRSEIHVVRVLPLPSENVPPTFNGAVGTYTMTVSAGPTNLAVGDPITLKVQLRGQGLLDALSLPVQPHWRDFKTYPPTGKVDAADPLGLSGVKTFEQVVIPQNHEVHALPPFEFTFFDPGTKGYRTLTGPAVPLSVRSTFAAAPPPMLTNHPAGETPPVDDILHIKPRLEPLGLRPQPLVQQPWFLALQGVPALTWLSLWLVRKRGESLANNPRLRRRREVSQRVREGLRQLGALAAERKADEFFALLFRLLQEQLGERLDAPASAITEAVIDEKLRHGAARPETLAELHALFQLCNQARYARGQSSQELASLIPRTEAVLRELQQTAT